MHVFHLRSKSLDLLLQGPIPRASLSFKLIELILKLLYGFPLNIDRVLEILYSIVPPVQLDAEHGGFVLELVYIRLDSCFCVGLAVIKRRVRRLYRALRIYTEPLILSRRNALDHLTDGALSLSKDAPYPIEGAVAVAVTVAVAGPGPGAGVECRW